MKKTYNINLNGQVFCIDEDACLQLQDYINTLEKHYLHEEDGQEIMSDIESRIAELFREFLQKSHRDIITQTEIKKIIEVMGSPEVIIDDDPESASSAGKASKKLYRDSEHKVLGGVASGLAAYFAISPMWVRLAFILLAFLYGFTIIIYLVLWIVLPPAVTARQKLEMQGEKINVTNIEKNIRNTYTKVRKNTQFHKISNQFCEKCSAFFSGLWQIFRKTIEILAHILIILAMIISIFFFLTACWGIFFTFHLLPENYLLFLQYLSSPVPLWVIKLILFCFINLPLLVIIYYSLRYFFKYKSHKGFLLTTGIVWLLSCFAVIFLSIFYAANHAWPYETRTEIALSPINPRQHTLTIKFPPHTEMTNHLFKLEKYLYTAPGLDSNTLYFRPVIRFTKTDLQEPQLILIKEARGFSGIDAANNRESIQYEYNWENDTLFLNNYFTLDKPKLRANQLGIDILIPEKYKVIIEDIPWQQVYNSGIFAHPYHTLIQTKHQAFIMEDGKLKMVSK